MAVGAGFVWVTLDGSRPVVAKLDPHTMKVVKEIPLASAGGITVGAGLVVGAGSLWVLNWDRSLVTRVDLGPGRRVSAPVPAAGDAFDFAVGDGAVWVTNRTPGTVTRIDVRSGRPSGPPIQVGDSPKGIAVLAGSAWVANSGSRSVTRLRSSSP